MPNRLTARPKGADAEPSWTRLPPGWETGEEHHSMDIAALNRDKPGWDKRLRENGALRRLRSGMPLVKVTAIFGSEVAKEALRRYEVELAEIRAGAEAAPAGHVDEPR